MCPDMLTLENSQLREQQKHTLNELRVILKTINKDLQDECNIICLNRSHFLYQSLLCQIQPLLLIVGSLEYFFVQTFIISKSPAFRLTVCIKLSLSSFRSSHNL